jgi:hypothetical protein
MLRTWPLSIAKLHYTQSGHLAITVKAPLYTVFAPQSDAISETRNHRQVT